jgi:hypothetical protein
MQLLFGVDAVDGTTWKLFDRSAGLGSLTKESLAQPKERPA